MLHIQITRDFVHLEAGLYGMKNTIATEAMSIIFDGFFKMD
jgi:hypothetical protein